MRQKKEKELHRVTISFDQKLYRKMRIYMIDWKVPSLRNLVNRAVERFVSKEFK